LAQVIEREPIPPRLLRPEIPRELEFVCLRLLEKRPDARYPSAAALADDLERFLRGEGVQLGRAGVFARLRRWARREPEMASRLLGQTEIVLLTQVNFLLNPEPDVAVHWQVTGVELSWLFSTLVFRRLSRLEGRAERFRPAWIAVDVAVLTAMLRLLGAATSSLIVGYPLLIAASGLWHRVPLVWLTTAFSMLGYAALALDARSRGVAIDSNHHPNILLAALAVTGFVVAHQVRRISALSHYDN
jgi:serine/threonine-protein kinase